MLALLLLSVVACAWAQLYQSDPQDLGPFDVDVSIGGSCKPRYKPLSAADKFASLNAKIWISSVLPSYDPYVLSSVGPFKFDSLMVSGEGSASNIVVKGVKGLDIVNLDVRVYHKLKELPYRADLNVTLPVVNAEADVDASVNLVFVPTKITGHVKIKLEGVQAKGSSCASPTVIQGREVFQHTSLKARAHVDKVQVTLITNGYPEWENNKELLLWAANSLKETVAQTVGANILKKANELLGQYSRAQVESYLVSVRDQ